MPLTLTFAAIDWLMTLDYHWYSTIFGTYVWSGAAVSSLALLTIVVAGASQRAAAGKSADRTACTIWASGYSLLPSSGHTSHSASTSSSGTQTFRRRPLG